MKFARFSHNDRVGLAAASTDSRFRGFYLGELPPNTEISTAIEDGPAAVQSLAETLMGGREIELDQVELLPPLAAPGKIICVGLNYIDHSAEAGFVPPTYPTIFSRFTSSLVGHGQAIRKPRVSDQLDYEGEIAVIIGKGGRDIPLASSLDHVFGYSLFNDASVRDYQLRTPQWTVGKNFDATGAFGPYIVTADELPPGAQNLTLETHLNDKIVQKASTNDLVFDVPTLIALLSEAFTLSAGDVIVSGTPSGVGMARKPPLWMKVGDEVSVSVTGLGSLVNPVLDA